MDEHKKHAGGRPVGTATAVTRAMDTVEADQQHKKEAKQAEVAELRLEFEPWQHRAAAALQELEDMERKYGDVLARLDRTDWLSLCGIDPGNTATNLTSRITNLQKGMVGQGRTLREGIHLLQTAPSRELLEDGKRLVKGCLSPTKSIEDAMAQIQALVQTAQRLAQKHSGLELDFVSPPPPPPRQTHYD